MTEQEYYLTLQKSENNPIYKYEGLEYREGKSSGFKYSFEYLDEYSLLKVKYKLENIARNGSDLSKALNIMQWLTDNSYYCGESPFGDTDVFSILDYSLKGGFKHAIRCDLKIYRTV